MPLTIDLNGQVFRKIRKFIRLDSIPTCHFELSSEVGLFLDSARYDLSYRQKSCPLLVF
jgi:hypothetical protein